MSRKTVAFSVPAPRAPDEVITKPRRSGAEGRPDAWVRERALDVPATPAEIPLFAAPPRPADLLMLDLAANRTLPDVFFLSFLAPWALGWFWLMQAMTGRPRF